MPCRSPADSPVSPSSNGVPTDPRLGPVPGAQGDRHSKPLSEGVGAAGLGFPRYILALTHSHEHWDEIVKVLAPQGEICLIDDPATPIDVMKLKSKSGALHIELMMTRSTFQTPDMEQQGYVLDEIATMVDEGLLKTTVGENYGTINAANLRRAHAAIESPAPWARLAFRILMEAFGTCHALSPAS